MIASIDHIVLTVRDVNATCDFYSRVLGMRVATFGEGRFSLEFGDQKINLHQLGKEFEPKAEQVKPGSVDICFVLNASLDEAVTRLGSEAVPIELGPVDRVGARGKMRSVYFRDPDGNLVELCSYEPQA